MFEIKVEKFLEQHSFSFINQKVVIGVSGGPDSMALLHYLANKRSRWKLSIVAAHVDHMFRGKESYEDALYVKDYCEQNDIAFEMKRINVPEHIASTGKSPQVAARDCRYDFLGEVMDKYDFGLLALAHHGDDQVETMLMRFTRGSSGTGRAGIPFLRKFQNGQVIRPFLSLTKEDIEDYCYKHQIVPRRDPSNQKGSYVRNRFRNVVLPFLKMENPLVHQHFQRFSEELQEDEALLQELTAARLNKVIMKRDKGSITVDIQTFAAMPMPLQRRGIQLILNYLYEVKPASLSAIHINQVHSLLQSPQPSGMLDFPNGLKVIRSYQVCHFKLGDFKNEPFYFELGQPSTVSLPNGRTITMEFTDQFIPSIHPNCSLFNANDMQLPFIIRSRKNGDRMSLKGTMGSRKIKDIFIDKKIPLDERENWPVVTDREGTIIWLPGLKKSAYEVKSECGNRFILFTYN